MMFLLALFLIQCAEKKTQPNVKAKAWCVQSDTAMYIRMNNVTNHSLFIPKQYLIQYLAASDTLYFESVEKSQFGVRDLYFYSKFSQVLCTYNKIEGLSYDSVETYKSSANYFQFQPPTMCEIKPNSSFKDKISIKLPKTFRYGVFRIYDKNYILDSHKDYGDYHSYDNFLQYERGNSFKIIVEIYSSAHK